MKRVIVGLERTSGSMNRQSFLIIQHLPEAVLTTVCLETIGWCITQGFAEFFPGMIPNSTKLTEDLRIEVIREAPGKRVLAEALSSAPEPGF